MVKLLKPEVLTIDASTRCQLRCPTCPTTSEGTSSIVGSGYLKLDDLKRLLDANPHIQGVNFENRGELFLNPELLSIIEYGHKKGLSMTNTSGVNLNTVQHGVLEGLVKYRFRHLLCSIDGATPEIYRIYRVGGDFNQVIENIKTINRYKSTYHEEYPRLTWQFVVFGHNEHELVVAKKLAKDLHMQFVPKMSWNSGYSPVRDKDLVLAETGWSSVTREEFRENTGKDYMRAVCYALWQSPRVNWDGRILGCCWNSWGEFGGNAFNEGYLESINSEKIHYAREMLMGNVPPVDDVPCTTCSLYIQMREFNTYLTLKEIFPPVPLEQSLYGYFTMCPLLYYPTRFAYRALGLKKLKGWMRKRGERNS